MPLWHIYHPPWAFTEAGSKDALAKAITAFYQRVGMPAFYVSVIFHPTPGQDFFVGGKPQSEPNSQPSADVAHPARPFIRLVGDHIAVNDISRADKVCTFLDVVLKPHIADKGYDWEYHIDETPTEYWRIQGLKPPPFGSEEMKMWARENRAVPWEKL